jgi:hypothetical protein
VHPQHLSRGSVDRDRGAAGSCRRIHHALHDERRRFELKFLARTEILGLEPPGNFEVLEVGAVDLIERSIAMVREVPAVAAPIGVGRGILAERWQGQPGDQTGGRRDAQKRGRESPAHMSSSKAKKSRRKAAGAL